MNFAKDVLLFSKFLLEHNIDISKLKEAYNGIFFRPTKKIANEYPEFHVTNKFNTLKKELQRISNIRVPPLYNV